MNILITGVAGFIGSNLADYLLRHYRTLTGKIQIVGIDNLAYGVYEHIPQGVDFHKLDIRSKDIYPLFKNIDFVFHLAAKNCLNDCQKDPVETSDINVTGTVNVFEAAKRAGVKKIIYAETSALYEGSEIFPTPESEVFPEGFYATGKFAGMYFAKAYERFFKMNFTALRYFNVYGPRQDYRRSIPPVMSAFIIRLLSGQPPIIYGSGNKKRDFVYVDVVNDFHLKCLLDSRTDGKTFNIGSSESFSIYEIYQKISHLLNIDIPPLYKGDLTGEAQETLADIKEARHLGWSPRMDIDAGLSKMIEYIKLEIEKGNIVLSSPAKIPS